MTTAAQLAIAALLTLWLLLVAGMPRRWALAAAGALVLLLAAMLAGLLETARVSRLQGVVTTDTLARVLPFALVLALALLVATRAWGWRRARWWAVALRCAVLLIFTLRLGGMLHPQFAHVDHRLRLNQLVAIAAGQAEQVRPQLEQQHEWGTREPVPYSLFTYYLLVPLTWLWDGRESWFISNSQLLVSIKLVMALLEASVPLLLWGLLRGGPQRNAGAAWAGLCYAALPVGYLYFHDGSFPTTIGLWVAMLALLAARAWIERQQAAGDVSPFAPEARPLLWRWLLVVALLAAALVAYITHIVFVPLLVAVLLVSMYTLDNTGRLRSPARWLALALAAALLLVWLVYYAGYTVTLVQRTIPAFLALLENQGAIGQDAEQFFGTPPKTFGEHLYAHFRTWPVLLAGAALAALLVGWRRRFVTHLGLAYAALLLLTSLADTRFNLWNKHMYFSAPGVALLAGVALVWLWRRGRAGRVVSIALLVLLFWESTLAWGSRVLWFVILYGPGF